MSDHPILHGMAKMACFSVRKPMKDNDQRLLRNKGVGAAAGVLALTLCGLHAGLQAQTVQEPATAANASSPRAGERLSDWILRQTNQSPGYITGLQWQVPGERRLQAELKAQLLAQLADQKQLAPDRRARFLALIDALPVTGRVPLTQANPRWLQAHPQHDPLLQGDHQLRLPERSTTVSVLTEDASRCEVEHQSTAQARDYLAACEPARLRQIDRAWVIQADGSISDVGIADWNAQTQDALAPGAWIWAPTRQSGWSSTLSRQLAQYLATQTQASLQTIPTRHTPFDPKGPAAGPQLFAPAGAAARDLPLTANDWGLIGLLQTPSARMAPAGELRFHYSQVQPYERFNVFVQPFDALELGFRYSNVLNRAYGPYELSRNQTYKDKSLDFKLRLWEESAALPQLAVGITDLGGTGLFSSEYLVASKRWGAWDWSLGLGWGYMAASGNIANPLAKLDKRFENRGLMVGQGGIPSTNAFFRGPSALFGGVQYHLPWSAWVLKAEYDGNNYRHEPQANVIQQRWPINLGLVYRHHPQIDFSLGLERGNRVMMGLTLHTAVSRMHAPKVSDAPTVQADARAPADRPWVASAADMSDMSGWGVRSIAQDGQTLRVVLDNASGAHWNERIERITAVLNRDAPPSVGRFELVIAEQGVLMTERVIDRAAWVQRRTELLPPSQALTVMAAVEPRPQMSATAQTLWDRSPTRFGYGLIPTWQQNIGGPDGFLLFRAGVAIPMRLQLAENTAISATVNVNLADNFGKFKYTAPSDLPRVRTYLREYMTTSRVNIPTLQVTHFGRLASNQYYSAYAGYLESMYGGLGAEWLYRPWHSPLALGVDINRVQQRDFDQFFGFGKAGSQTGYRVTTGHATVYWDTGWQSTRVKLSAGRYLAGDIGATLDLGKTFDNGVSVGAWATKTNISAQRFGEGSFDKGLYLRIPFDVMTTTRTGNTANLVYNPLTRDGGARLGRAFTLYGATTGRDKRDTAYEPAAPGLYRPDR